METRPYQTDGEERIAELMRQGCRSLVYVLPTGGGKTRVAGGLAARASRKQRRQAFVVHRRELVRQAHKELSLAIPGEEIGVIASGWPTLPWARVQVVSLPTVINRLNDLDPFHVAHIDEGHHCRAATWEKFIRWLKAHGTRMVFYTATPERLDGKGMGEWCEQIVLGPGADDLIRDGHLAPTRLFRVSKSDAAGWKGTNTVADAMSAYEAYSPGRRAIFFGRTVTHSQEVCEALRGRGWRVAHLDASDGDARRDRVFSQFRAGDIQVLGNCGLFSEGIDVPGCEVVMVGRRTRSVTDWLQMCGRCMRPWPGKVAMVLDTGGSSWQHGPPSLPRQWSLEDGEVIRPSEGESAFKPREGRTSDPVEMVEAELVEAGGAEECAAVPPREPKEDAPRPPRAHTRMSRKRWLEMQIRRAKQSEDPVAELERLWVGIMARVHRM